MPNDDERLRLYLLGELPEEESDRLEKRLLVEDELFELSDAIEAEVLEALSRGELSAGQRQRIEDLLSRSPRLRSRAALVRGLAEVADEDGWSTILPFSPRIDMARPAVRFGAIAAMLLMMTGATWLAVSLVPNGADLRNRVVIVPPTPSPSPPVIPTPRPSAEPDVLAHRPETPPAPPASPVPPMAEITEVVPTILQLALLTTRGGEDVVDELTLSRTREQVDIQVLLDAGDEYPSFTVALLGEGGREIASASGVKARQTAGGAAAVVLRVPRRELAAGTYTVDVYGVPRAGEEPKYIGSTEFEVRG